LNVNLPVAGSLYVFGHQDAKLQCGPDPNPCTAVWGVYVDDTPVPGSGRPLTAPAGSNIRSDVQLFGILAGLSAGAHTLKVGFKPSANTSSVTFYDRQVGGILLGGAVAVSGRAVPGSAPRAVSYGP
jgi:hypothetical protein